jgi:hypothetical protein
VSNILNADFPGSTVCPDAFSLAISSSSICVPRFSVFWKRSSSCLSSAWMRPSFFASSGYAPR